MTKRTIIGIGNVYVETNFLGVNTGGNDFLEGGREYRAQDYEIKPAGSPINMVRQAMALGVRVGLIGKIGRDDMGELLKKLLQREGINTELLVESDHAKTSIDTGSIFSHGSGEVMQ